MNETIYFVCLKCMLPYLFHYVFPIFIEFFIIYFFIFIFRGIYSAIKVLFISETFSIEEKLMPVWNLNVSMKKIPFFGFALEEILKWRAVLIGVNELMSWLRNSLALSQKNVPFLVSLQLRLMPISIVIKITSFYLLFDQFRQGLD